MNVRSLPCPHCGIRLATLALGRHIRWEYVALGRKKEAAG